MITISKKETGRQWGNKKPFQIIRKFSDNGIKCVECEADFWEGPDEPGKTGQYERRRWIERADYFVASNCSFNSQIAKALS